MAGPFIAPIDLFSKKVDASGLMKHYKVTDYEILPYGEGRWIRLGNIKETLSWRFWAAVIMLAVRALV